MFRQNIVAPAPQAFRGGAGGKFADGFESGEENIRGGAKDSGDLRLLCEDTETYRLLIDFEGMVLKIEADRGALAGVATRRQRYITAARPWL